MESREGQYRAKEVAGGQYRILEVTGRLVQHTRSCREVTTAQTKSRGVITAHWRSLIKSGSVIATLRIPTSPPLHSGDCVIDATSSSTVTIMPSPLRPCAPRLPSQLDAIDLRLPPFFCCSWPAAPSSVVDPIRPVVPGPHSLSPCLMTCCWLFARPEPL